MIRVMVLLAALVLTIWCAVELTQSPASRVRALPKWLWAVFILGVPVLGPALWLAIGRPLPPRPRSSGPDDDEDFLRGLRR